MRDTPFLDDAGHEAEALKHSWIGVEHLLLALGGGTSRAAAALDEVELWVAPPGEGEWRGATMTPAIHEVFAFVEGFTVGREAAAEDVLIAVLWLHPESFAGRRDEIAGRLRGLGVEVPELPPLPPPVDYGDEVRFPLDRLWEVLAVVHRSDPHVKIAFDHDGAGEAWIVAERGFDLESVVASALAPR